ncbi:hypothetical protein Tco_0488577 [Tanacetum coccineum]
MPRSKISKLNLIGLLTSNLVDLQDLFLVTLNKTQKVAHLNLINLCKLEMSRFLAFGGNICDLGSFGEETDKTTTLHLILEEVVHIECGDGVTSFKRRRQDVRSDGVRDLVTASEHGRPKETLKDFVL